MIENLCNKHSFLLLVTVFSIVFPLCKPSIRGKCPAQLKGEGVSSSAMPETLSITVYFTALKEPWHWSSLNPGSLQFWLWWPLQHPVNRFEAENQITPLVQWNNKRTEKRLSIYQRINKPQPVHMLHQASWERYLKSNANTLYHAPSSTSPDLYFLFTKGATAPNFPDLWTFYSEKE